jgi:hypothetical protein
MVMVLSGSVVIGVRSVIRSVIEVGVVEVGCVVGPAQAAGR